VDIANQPDASHHNELPAFWTERCGKTKIMEGKKIIIIIISISKRSCLK
jgi:hypothetical protein